MLCGVLLRLMLAVMGVVVCGTCALIVLFSLFLCFRVVLAYFFGTVICVIAGYVLVILCCWVLLVCLLVLNNMVTMVVLFGFDCVLLIV